MDEVWQYPCPDKECECVRCTHRIQVFDNPYENQYGEAVYRAMCTHLSPPELFEIPAADFEERLRNNNTKTTQTDSSTAPDSSIDDDSTEPIVHRHRGRSNFDGRRVHQDIESDSQKQFIKVNNRKFKLTRSIDWDIADRMLKAVRDRESDYVIDLTTSECNALSQGGKAFVKYCLERQPLAKPIRGKKYTGKARIKPDLLRANQI